jgi:menaquinone-dependent protoporphyrinogen oxidase
MSKILVLYGTTNGHTRKIAEFLRETFQTEGCRVDVVDSADATFAVMPDEYEAVVVAASIHMGDYQRPVERWVRQHGASLSARPSAFLSVCLAVVEQRPEARADAERIMRLFLERCGWRPAESRLVAGAVLFTKYGWLTRFAMKRIVKKAGGETDTSRDYEYTDWDELRAFARDFVRRHELAPLTTGPTTQVSATVG